MADSILDIAYANPAEKFAVCYREWKGEPLTPSEMDRLNTMIDYCEESVGVDYEPPWYIKK